MSILVTGAKGQLGMDVVQHLSQQSELKGFSREEWDVTDEAQSMEIISRYKPKTLIHCAAYTQVDQSEDEPEKAYAVNVKGSRCLAQLCTKYNIRLVYISTDYVFNGQKSEGYTELDAPHPINVYGRTKRLGERWIERLCPRHLIIRTSWLYGLHGNNFVYAILKRAQETMSLEVVNDQVGSPTFTGHLAMHVGELLQTECTGVFHLANQGSCSWYDFACQILQNKGYDVQIKPIFSKDLRNRKAKRPTHSVLRSVRLKEQGFPNMPLWEEGLSAFMQQLNKGEDDK